MVDVVALQGSPEARFELGAHVMYSVRLSVGSRDCDTLHSEAHEHMRMRMGLSNYI